MYRVRDVDTWSRRAAFQFFSSFDDPNFGLTVELDVSRFVPAARTRVPSFSVQVLHAVMRAVNTCEAFRQRIVDGEVRVYDTVHPSWTSLAQGEDSLCIASCAYDPSLAAFADLVAEGEETARTQDDFLGVGALRPDLVHFSMVPWISFTGLRHARRSGPTAGEPKITIGRYHGQEDGLRLPVEVSAHHALMDGSHVATFLEGLQAIFDEAVPPTH